MKTAVGRLVFAALTLMGLAELSAPASGAGTPSSSSGIVTYAFGGTVDASTIDGVNPGSHFSGTFTYDSTLSNGGTAGTFDFSQLPVAHAFSVGAGTFNDQSISSLNPTSPLDQYTIQLTNNGLGTPSTFVLTTSTVQNPNPDAVTLTLTDPSGKLFSPNALPVSLNLASFSAATVNYDPPAGIFSGDITSLQQLGGAAVPEPGSALLLGVGIAVLAACRKRLVIL